MPLDDRVRAGRVDESDVGEEWRGMRPVDDSRTLLTLGGPLAVIGSASRLVIRMLMLDTVDSSAIDTGVADPVVKALP